MLRKIYAGCYRYSSTLSFAFGHIRRNGALWQADIRNSETGDLIRCAGLWATRREAQDEVRDLLWRDYRAEG
jgi:hypothetical protein